jgi:hypothetical protein
MDITASRSLSRSNTCCIWPLTPWEHTSERHTVDIELKVTTADSLNSIECDRRDWDSEETFEISRVALIGPEHILNHIDSRR